mgnify:FL=1
MPYSPIRKARVLLADPSGTMPGSGSADLQALLDRGSREVARRGLLYQARESIALTANTRVYTLRSDHVQTFSMFRERFSASVRLLSQDAHVWWATVSTTGILTLTDAAAPAGHILLNTPNTYWLEILSPDATRWHVYPSPLGAWLVSTVQPATGPGTTSTLQFRDIWATPWYPAVSNVGGLSASQTGAATLSATALNDHAMHRVEPEAVTRIDPRTATGAPERYAITGKLLYVHPTPDAAYQLLHSYFSDAVSWQPSAAQYLPVVYATAMGLLLQHRSAPAQMLRDQILTTTLTLMAANLSPGSRDSLDSYRMPST